MSRICSICDKCPQVGNLVSHANNKTKRWVYPNTHKMVLQNPSGSAIRPPPVQPRRILQQINTWPEIDCAACR